MSVRDLQLASVLKRAVQAVLDAGLSDPRISGLITVTDVKVARDRRSATVFVSVMPHDRESLVMHGLRAASRHIRRRAADHIEIRRMPELMFKLDRGLKHQAEVIETLAHLRQEQTPQKESQTEAPDEPAGDDE